MRYKAIKTRLKLNKHDQYFLRILFRSSKNLYNCALYNVRQHFIKTGKYLSYKDNYHLLKNTEHYKMLHSNMAQAVIKKVDEAMKAFFGSLKSDKSSTVRLPKYLDKDGFYPLIDRMIYKPDKTVYILPRSNFFKRLSKLFTYGLKKKQKNILQSLPLSNVIKELHIKIETPKCIQTNTIKEITIKPKFDGKYIEVIHVYEVEDILALETDNKTETMGIDLGYVNLATAAVTNGNHLLIDGRKLKSYNQWYAKRMAYLQRTRTMSKSKKYQLKNKKVPYTKQMIRLENKRKNRITYGINKAARIIMNHALENNVGKIIIGWNEGFKEISTNDKNNQWFKRIPLARLKDRIEALCLENHIDCIIVSEEYTSKASYFDDDILPTFDSPKQSFNGKRLNRGLFITKEGKKINADINAALNILRKGNPNAEKLRFSGVNTPKRTYLF